MNSYFNRLTNNLIASFKYHILITLFLSIYRLIFTIKFYPEKTDFEIIDIVKAYYFGFRYDNQYVSYFIILFIVLSIISAFSKSNKVFKLGSKIFFPLIIFSTLLLALSDYFFFINFQKHLDIEAFRMFGDEANVLFKTAWKDYPVIRAVIVAIVLITGCIYVTKKITSHEPKQRKLSFNIIFLIAFVILFMLSIRGSFGTFPLRTKHATISNKKFINDIVINPIFSFKEALSLKCSHKINIDLNKTLNEYGYNSIDEAFKIYFDSTSVNHDNLLFLKTNEDIKLDQHKPNVILILMESFGNHQFLMNSKTLNTLGELENQLKDCITFTNFTSNKNGTNETMESIIISAPQKDIPRSQYSTIRFKSSIANPFRKKGYEVEYLYMGSLGWRGMGKFCTTQGFTNMFGCKEIQKRYPDTQVNDWGAHDEYFFRLLFDRIKKNNDNGKPMFALALNGTNHSPYMLPDNYTSKNQNIPESIYNKAKICKEQVDVDFATYQYSADCLGKFIKKLKESKYGKNTIIAITGDHNNRHLFNYGSDNLFLWKSVPFILYTPKSYLKNKKINTSKFGSHKDIMPTLYNLSLSDSKYFNSGNDLLSNKEQYFFSKNTTHAYKDSIIVNISNSEAYKFEGKSTIHSKHDEKTKELIEKAKAYEFIMKYAIIKNIKEEINKTKPIR